MDIVTKTLAEYGATLTPQGHLVKNGKILQVRVVIIRFRVRFEAATGRLLASGPIAAPFVQSFVERFYGWGKSNGCS